MPATFLPSLRSGVAGDIALFGLPKETRLPFMLIQMIPIRPALLERGCHFQKKGFGGFLFFASRLIVEANFGKIILSLLRGCRLASTLERGGRFQRQAIPMIVEMGPTLERGRNLALKCAPRSSDSRSSVEHRSMPTAPFNANLRSRSSVGPISMPNCALVCVCVCISVFLCFCGWSYGRGPLH